MLSSCIDPPLWQRRTGSVQRVTQNKVVGSGVSTCTDATSQAKLAVAILEMDNREIRAKQARRHYTRNGESGPSRHHQPWCKQRPPTRDCYKITVNDTCTPLYSKPHQWCVKDQTWKLRDKTRMPSPKNQVRGSNGEVNTQSFPPLLHVPDPERCERNWPTSTRHI